MLFLQRKFCEGGG